MRTKRNKKNKEVENIYGTRRYHWQEVLNVDECSFGDNEFFKFSVILNKSWRWVMYSHAWYQPTAYVKTLCETFMLQVSHQSTEVC